MRTILFALALTLPAGVVATACGAQPNQPVLANVPKPNTAAVAGGAAAAAAAITLASPDSANPEKRKQEQEKKPITVKEHVPAATLDRLDKTSEPDSTEAAQPAAPSSASVKPKSDPAGSKTDAKAPKSALDFGEP
jgi:hypothetical protein